MAITRAGKRLSGNSETATTRIRKSLQYSTQVQQVNLNTDTDPDDLNNHELGRVAKPLFFNQSSLKKTTYIVPFQFIGGCARNGTLFKITNIL